MKKQRWLYSVKEISNDYILQSPDGQVKDEFVLLYTLNEEKARQEMEKFPITEGWHIELWRHPLGVAEHDVVHGPYSEKLAERDREEPEELEEESPSRYILVGRRKGKKTVGLVAWSDKEFLEAEIEDIKDDDEWVNIVQIDTLEGEEID